MELPSPPPQVGLSVSVDGLHIQLPPQRISAALRILIIGLCLIFGSIVALFGVLIAGGLNVPNHGLFFSATAAVGVAVGGVLSFVVIGLLEQPHAPSRHRIVIDHHHLTLQGGRRIPLSSIMLVDSTAEPRLVLRDGERLALARGSRPAIQDWLVALLRGALAQNAARGAPADVPAALRALQGQG
ncbi:MAG: hypothetical protein ACI8S6_002247 [Myxococcota bacterium]|jgi:hypothetical protein